jgi:hypothetical protein
MARLQYPALSGIEQDWNNRATKIFETGALSRSATLPDLENQTVAYVRS